MPPIHESKNQFWTALHDPTAVLTLKDVTDSLKNYAMSAATFALGLGMSKAVEPWMFIAGCMVILLSLLLSGATLCQAWVLAQKAAHRAAPFTYKDYAGITPWQTWLKIVMLLSIPIGLAYISIAAAMWVAAHAQT